MSSQPQERKKSYNTWIWTKLLRLSPQRLCLMSGFRFDMKTESFKPTVENTTHIFVDHQCDFYDAWITVASDRLVLDTVKEG